MHIMLYRDFLEVNDIVYKRISLIRHDASVRKYYRLENREKTILLMDSSCDVDALVKFLRVRRVLNKFKVRVPKIFFFDSMHGFLILEDFGDLTLCDLISRSKDKASIYKVLADIIIHISKIPKSEFLADYQQFTKQSMRKLFGIFIDWLYMFQTGCMIDIYIKNDFLALLDNLLEDTDIMAMPYSLILKDFHTENMMALNQPIANLHDVGILDFQDAMYGPCVYDLVSLLNDSRIFVSFTLQKQIIKYYLLETKINRQIFYKIFNLLSVYQNIIHIGLFARKSLRDGDDRYLRYIPHCKLYLNYVLNEDGDFYHLKNFLINKFNF